MLRRAGRLKFYNEMERAPFAFLAFDPNASPHEFDQSARNGQAQTGAAISPGYRTVGLGEFFENVPEAVPRNANAGVFDHEIQK